MEDSIDLEEENIISEDNSIDLEEPLKLISLNKVKEINLKGNSFF